MISLWKGEESQLPNLFCFHHSKAGTSNKAKKQTKSSVEQSPKWKGILKSALVWQVLKEVELLQGDGFSHLIKLCLLPWTGELKTQEISNHTVHVIICWGKRPLIKGKRIMIRKLPMRSGGTALAQRRASIEVLENARQITHKYLQKRRTK